MLSFVSRENSEEVIRLAEELGELDRCLARLRDHNSTVPASEGFYPNPTSEELAEMMDDVLASILAEDNATQLSK